MNKRGSFLKGVTLNKMTKSSFLLVGRELVGTKKEFQKTGIWCVQMPGSAMMDADVNSGEDGALRCKPGTLGMTVHTGLHHGRAVRTRGGLQAEEKDTRIGMSIVLFYLLYV